MASDSESLDNLSSVSSSEFSEEGSEKEEDAVEGSIHLAKKKRPNCDQDDDANGSIPSKKSASKPNLLRYFASKATQLNENNSKNLR